MVFLHITTWHIRFNSATSQRIYLLGTLFRYTFFVTCSIRIGELGCLLMMLLPFCMNEYYFGGHISFVMPHFWYLGISCCELIELFSFLGPNIWLEYGQYSVGGIGQKGGLDRVRSVFERALSSVGLHMTKGLAIWEAYREFENAIVEAARVSSPSPWPVLAFE